MQTGESLTYQISTKSVDGFMGCLESFVNYALLWIGLTVNWDSHL
jgi:hypothetical protein